MGRDLERLETGVRSLLEEVDDAGEERLERFEERYRQLRSLIDSIGTKELPHKQAIRAASKRIAAEIGEDIERGLLSEGDVELFDPVFAKLRYGEEEAAREALEEARGRAKLLDRYREALERYERAHRSERRELRNLEEELDEVGARRKSLDDALDPGAAEELRRFREALEDYNEAVEGALERFLESPSSEVLGLVLDAGYFPETRPPKPRDRGAAEELAELEEFTVFDLLDAERQSDERLAHTVDDVEGLRDLLESNPVWLRRVSNLSDTDFLKMEVEDPAVAEHRASTVKRFLRRIGGPIEELEEVEEAASDAGEDAMLLAEVSEGLDAGPEEAMRDVEERVEELEERVEERKRVLESLRAPESLRLS